MTFSVRCGSRSHPIAFKLLRMLNGIWKVFLSPCKEFSAMPPLPYADRESAVPRVGRKASGYALAGCARKSLLICRSRGRAIGLAGGPIEGAVGQGPRVPGQVEPCIFLFIPRHAPGPAPRRAVGTAAAPHKSLVNNKANTSARRSACNLGRAGRSCNHYGSRRGPPGCGAARAPNIKREQTGPAPLPCSRRWARNGRRVVKACSSLLIDAFRPRAEPVRSGNSRARPHGHRPPRRPPSPLIESGGRR
jgi:hypothetical protein